MQPTTNTRWYIIIIVLVVLLVSSLTWNILSSSVNKKAGMQTDASKAPGGASTTLFDTQSATFMGKITNVDGKKLTVENKRGVTGEIMAGDNILIMNPSSNQIATPSGDLKTVELNKEVMISLTVNGDQYVVNSINFIPPLPSFDPAKLPAPASSIDLPAAMPSLAPPVSPPASPASPAKKP